jgi:hypothetical protein
MIITEILNRLRKSIIDYLELTLTELEASRTAFLIWKNRHWNRFAIVPLLFYSSACNSRELTPQQVKSRKLSSKPCVQSSA